MRRDEFLRLSAGIVSGLGIPGMFSGRTQAAQPAAGTSVVLNDSYLVKGITGMARAEGWFNAHWGACVLAGYYLCRDNQLDESTTVGIKNQLDIVIKQRPAQFAPLPDEPVNEELIEEIPRALIPALEGGLRAHGHAVIFASLSVKALRDVPQLAQPAIVKRLCGLSGQIAKGQPQPPVNGEAYADTSAMIEATFDSLVRFQGLLGRPAVLRPNFTHMTTHTEALMNLDLMGYAELARAGHSGLRTHISAPVPSFDAASVATPDRVTLEEVMSQEFWNETGNQDRWRRPQKLVDNPNGDWIAEGHLFKLLYSYHRLIARVEDQEKIKLCSKILLERYWNPAVQGG